MPGGKPRLPVRAQPGRLSPPGGAFAANPSSAGSVSSGPVLQVSHWLLASAPGRAGSAPLRRPRFGLASLAAGTSRGDPAARAVPRRSVAFMAVSPDRDRDPARGNRAGRHRKNSHAVCDPWYGTADRVAAVEASQDRVPRAGAADKTLAPSSRPLSRASTNRKRSKSWPNPAQLAHHRSSSSTTRASPRRFASARSLRHLAMGRSRQLSLSRAWR